MSVDRNESSASHVIRFLWRDSGRSIPLWDADAVLPAGAAWLSARHCASATTESSK